MAGYLIAEEGTLAGLTIRLEEGEEWVLGRDPDFSTQVLEDPMVSRKHVICRHTTEGYVLENLSSVNPATQNGKVITEPVLLHEGDIIQIGNTFFRFSLHTPVSEIPAEVEEELSAISLGKREGQRFLIKVISGPNSGAEFYMERGKTYIIGKDSAVCDIVFHDLSVSRQHAKITVADDDTIFIEDLASRNGVIINGHLSLEKTPLHSQDVVGLGTTSFLLIDQEQVRETIYAPQVLREIEKVKEEEEVKKEEVAVQKKPQVPWNEMIIPYRHLIMAGCALLVVVVVFGSMLALFKGQPVEIVGKNADEQIKEALMKYPDLQFTYNQASGTLFIVGHVLTPIEKMEVDYALKSLPFVHSIEDNIVVDEYVWQSMNSLLATNMEWMGVSMTSPSPGRFVLNGYLQTPEQAQRLSDYVNLNFPYLDRLDNQVVVESNLTNQIESLLIERGFSGVTFQVANGELVLSGRIDGKLAKEFLELVNQYKGLKGIRMVKNFVVITTSDNARIDLSEQYQIQGYSKQDDKAMFVMINGKVFTEGNFLDGMLITAIEPNMVLLEKDGLKFKINYNLQ